MATANARVGSIYEVGIEGVGYMLADSPQRPVRRSTGVLDTQPPGSDDPLSERIGRYDMIGSSDWSGGGRQVMADRPNSDATRYADSEGIDPFTTPGQITCLPVATKLISETGFGQLRLVVASGKVVVQTDDDELTFRTALAGPDTVVGTMFGSGTIDDLATDGLNWYATNGASIRRSSLAANPGSDWSTVDVTEIEWIGDRLAGIDTAAFPLMNFTTFDNAGAEEVAGGRFAFPGATVVGICGGDGFAWWGVNRYRTGQVHYWQVDSDPTFTGSALQLPEGEHVSDLFFYLGNVFLSTSVGDPGEQVRKVYRCVHNGDGTLTPQLVVEMEVPLTSTVITHFAGLGKFVAWSWMSMESDDSNGIGVIDLETGGVARWLSDESGAAAATVWIAAWHNQFVFTVQAIGLYAPATATTYRPGVLETSTSDLGSPAVKHLDEIRLSTLPLPTATGASSVAVAYSIDGGANYTTAATYNTAAATEHSTELTTAVTTPSVRLRLTLTPTGDATDKPTVTAHVAKTHATGITDEILELPISCEDVIADVHDTTIAEDSGPGKGMARYRTLQALIGTKVAFQDVDWKVTGTTSLCEVVGVESTQVNVFNQNRGLNDQTAHVAIVKLRRPFAGN